MSSFDSAKGPSTTLRCVPAYLTRQPFELARRPEASSNTPAFCSSSWYFAISARICSCGMTPASESLVAFTMIMNRMVASLLGLGSEVYPYDEPGAARSTGRGPPSRSAARNGADDEKRLRPRRDRIGEGGVGRLVGQVPLAGKESQERPSLLGDVVPDRAAQHGIAGLERVEHRAPRDLAGDVERHLAFYVRQRPQVRGQHHTDHRSVCTSTESTAGRSRTIGVQLSPASADKYTCPPVVPKYTPHVSSESMAIASRSTLT